MENSMEISLKTGNKTTMCCAVLSCSVVSDSLQPQSSPSVPRQEYRGGLSCPPPGDLPNPGTKAGLLQCRRILFVSATREAHKYWSGQPIPSPGGFPDSGFELGSPTLYMDSLPAELPRKPIKLPHDPEITLLGIRPEKTIIQKDTCTQMFLAPVSTISTT